MQCYYRISLQRCLWLPGSLKSFYAQWMLPAKTQKTLILISAFLFFGIHILPVLYKRDFFPIVKYSMFSYLRRDPIYRGYTIKVIDQQNEEILWGHMNSEQNYFFPYKHRSMTYAISKLKRTMGSQGVAKSLFGFVKTENPSLKGLKVYRVSCDCLNFSESNLNVDQYLNENCDRILDAEVYE